MSVIARGRAAQQGAYGNACGGEAFLSVAGVLQAGTVPLLRVG
jgi:hypothetical protein